MKVITQNVKVELTAEESITLRNANVVIHKFLDILKNANCDSAYFEDSGREYDKEDFEYTTHLLEALGDEDPIIS